MNRTVITTKDGSKTIFVEALDETYHSTNGAMVEAKHIFIEQGLEYYSPSKKPLTIFEMGFGTGLNALLTCLKSEELSIEIKYLGIEAYPVENELLNQMDYAKYLNEIGQEIFDKIHSTPWDLECQINDNFILTKVHQKIENYIPLDNSVDIIYFDAFGPRAQKEMWDISILEKMFALLKSGGILVTYCANGQFKRDLKSLGFTLEALPGPPGKREMTRATK